MRASKLRTRRIGRPPEVGRHPWSPHGAMKGFALSTGPRMLRVGGEDSSATHPSHCVVFLFRLGLDFSARRNTSLSFPAALAPHHDRPLAGAPHRCRPFGGSRHSFVGKARGESEIPCGAGRCDGAVPVEATGEMPRTTCVFERGCPRWYGEGRRVTNLASVSKHRTSCSARLVGLGSETALLEMSLQEHVGCRI